MADVNQNEENFIQLKKDNILRIGIKDSDGNDTGEHLEFDMESIEYPLKLDKCFTMHKQNIADLNSYLTIIDKKYGNQKSNDKYLLSKKEKEEYECFKKFFEKEMEAIDLFIGKGGSKKLLNGRDPYYSFFNDFTDMIAPILSKLKIRVQDIKNKIESKYKIEEEKNVLK